MFFKHNIYNVYIGCHFHTGRYFLFCLVDHKSLKNKKFYYIITAADPQREAAEGTLLAFRGFIRCLPDAQEVGIVYRMGAWDKGDVYRHPAYEQAYEGRKTKMSRTWMITGVSSGFGYEMTRQLLAKGDVVIGTVRNTDKVEELIKEYPVSFDCRLLDVTDVPAVQALVRDSFEKHGRIDAIVSSAGYGLFGCVEELTDEEIDHIIEVRCEGICAGCGNVRCSNRMEENAQMERRITDMSLTYGYQRIFGKW